MTEQELNEIKSWADKFFDYTDERLLELTGFYGVHTYSDIDSKLANYFIDRSKRPYKIIIHISSPKIKRCTREINFFANAIINEIFVSTRKTSRTGLLCLKSQVACARDFGFKRIVLSAAHFSFDLKEKWNGYYTWGEYGFLMRDQDEQIKFLKLMKDYSREEVNIYDLLREGHGKDLWMKEGWAWKGGFDLNHNSTSSLILEHVYNQLIV